MRFADHKNPLLLEALGDLLAIKVWNKGDCSLNTGIIRILSAPHGVSV
jgi:hypothetical protein